MILLIWWNNDEYINQLSDVFWKERSNARKFQLSLQPIPRHMRSEEGGTRGAGPPGLEYQANFLGLRVLDPAVTPYTHFT